MPRKRQPPRLYLHKGQYIIRDGATFRRTGFSEGEAEAAERRLAEYIAAKWQPDEAALASRDPRLRDVIMAYAEMHIPTRPTPHRRRELASQCGRLIEFFGDKPVSAINGPLCRAYAARSSTQSMARHDLEIARAAVNHWAKEIGIAAVPRFTIPEKGKPRSGHLTRGMVARLLRAAHRSGGNQHIVRFIVIGLYTGTRSSATLGMGWQPNAAGGWFDLERGIMYRAPDGERETRKRKPTAVIPNRLLAYLRRWKRQDEASGAIIPTVVHWRGKPVTSIAKGFKSAVRAAGLPSWVSPHVLRHTAITWAVERGRKFATISSFFGITIQELERTYWHKSPEYQQEMRKSK